MPDKLQQLHEKVWIFPRDPNPDAVQPNVGVIVTPNQTVLVDAGNSPRHANRILSALLAMAAPPVNTVFYTHSHWDHTFGAVAWREPTPIAHVDCRARLESFAERAWTETALHEEMQEHPILETRNRGMLRAVHQWSEFKIILPEITFTSTLSLTLDGLTFDLKHVGGRHAPDSITVGLPEIGIKFLGDCYYPPPLHERESPEDIRFDIPLLESCLEEGYDTYIDGHGIPMTASQVRDMLTHARRQAGDET